MTTTSTLAGTITLAEQSTGTSLTLNVPAGVQAGEYLVAFIVTSGGTSTQPAGFTRPAGASNPGTAVSVYVDYRKVTSPGSEPASYTWTGITTGRTTGWMQRVSGGDGSVQFDVTATVGTNTGTGNTCVVASQTTASANDLLLSVVGGNAAVGLTWTPPSGMSTVSSSTGTGRGASLANVAQAAAGASGTKTWSWSQTNLEMRAVMVAIRPAPDPIGQALMPSVFGSARVVIEAAFGADLTDITGSGWTWTDISADVMYQSQVSITQGRADDTSQAQSASCSFTLLNSTGKYTPYAPAATYYPNVRRNTPIRIRVDLGAGASVRFQGYATGFTPDWSASPSGNLAVARVVALGMLRRLDRTAAPVRSPLTRTISYFAPGVYWPLEDPAGSPSGASSPSAGYSVAAMAASSAVVFGSTTVPAGAKASVDLTNGGKLTGQWSPPFPALSGFQVEWSMLLLSSASVADFCWINLANTATLAQISLSTATGATVTDNAGSPTTTSFSSPPTYGTWQRWSVVLDGTTANAVLTVKVDGSTIATHTFTSTAAPDAASIVFNPGNGARADGMHVTQVFYFPAPNTISAINTVSASRGYVGETASARLTRVATEQNVALTLTGSSAAPMGAQPTAAFLDIVRDCETVDDGLLYDGFDAGIGYICNSARYNLSAAVTADASAGQVAPPFAPVDDDQRTRNDVTATRASGSSARYVQQTGNQRTAAIGTYDVSLNVNTSDDAYLYNRAAWEAHLGTVDGLRFPNLNLDFAAASTIAQPWLSAADLGFRVDVTNVASVVSQAPPDSPQLLVEGYTETIDTTSWYVAVNCSPYLAWQVATSDGTSQKVSADDATLNASLTPSQTGAVSVTVGTLWTTSAGDFPLDIKIEGEQIRLSGISGSSSPQTFTISTRSVNGVSKSHTSGVAVDVWSPAVVAL